MIGLTAAGDADESGPDVKGPQSRASGAHQLGAPPRPRPLTGYRAGVLSPGMGTPTTATYNSGSDAWRRALRSGSLLGRAWAAVSVTARRYGPGVGRWLARTGTRIRQLVLYLGGFGSLVYAAFLISAVLGFVALGVALLVMEALSGPGDGRAP